MPKADDNSLDNSLDAEIAAIDVRPIQQRFYDDRNFHELVVALMQGIERGTVTLEDVEQSVILLKHTRIADRPRVTLM